MVCQSCGANDTEIVDVQISLLFTAWFSRALKVQNTGEIG